MSLKIVVGISPGVDVMLALSRIQWLRAYDAAKGHYMEESSYKKHSPEVEEFLEEIMAVCQRRGMILSPESPHEALEVVDLNDADVANVFVARDSRCSAGNL